eukprot:3637113-Rhodomonas_salina.1
MGAVCNDSGVNSSIFTELSKALQGMLPLLQGFRGTNALVLASTLLLVVWHSSTLVLVPGQQAPVHVCGVLASAGTLVVVPLHAWLVLKHPYLPTILA